MRVVGWIMQIINFTISPSVKAVAIQVDRINLPDFREVYIKLKLSESTKIRSSVIAQPFLVLTYHISDEHYEIISFAFASRRSAQDAKRYFENHLKQVIDEPISFPVPFEELDFIEHEHFEDIGEDDPTHEITHYDLSEKKVYIADEAMCTSKSNRIFEFKHQYQTI
jgi:hypothetical protein